MLFFKTYLKGQYLFLYHIMCFREMAQFILFRCMLDLIGRLYRYNLDKKYYLEY